MEDQEIKNMKYKSAFYGNSNNNNNNNEANIAKLDLFLENEKNSNVNEPWCKLNKGVKHKKIETYIETYKQQHELSEEECNLMNTFLLDCIERKKLQRVKDVIYDKETGIIKDIPALCFVKATKHFTLKHMDAKRVSTLKSLAPKKSQTVRKKNEQSDSEDETEP